MVSQCDISRTSYQLCADKAVHALKDLIIEAQGSLLHQLAEAEQDDNITDFSSLINTAVRTRRRAENVLNDLYLRTEEKEKETVATAAIPVKQAIRQSTAHTLIPAESPKQSRVKFWRRSSNTTPYTGDSSDAASISSPTTVPQSPSVSRHSTAALSDITRRSTFSMTSPSWNPERIHAITEASNLGGFCKGAWRAQRYELGKAVTSSIKSFERRFHCTKCSFMLPADMRDKDRPRFDDRIYKLDGMRFRLLFLLKSHMSQKNARDGRKYGCILCVLAGLPQRMFIGEGHLLEHVFHHQQQVFGNVSLVGPLSLESDGVKSESFQDFDVLFDREKDFALPPSMLGDNESLDEITIDVPDDIFGNVWADERR